MENTILKINIITISISGVIMAAGGLVLYAIRDSIAPYMRFLLPVPPVGVAAYVFVFNMFAVYNGRLPASTFQTIREISLATLFSASIFLVFTLLLVLLVHFIMKWV